MLVSDRDIPEQPPKVGLTDFFPFLREFENPLVVLLAAVLILLLVLLLIAGAVRSARKEKRRNPKEKFHRMNLSVFSRQQEMKQAATFFRDGSVFYHIVYEYPGKHRKEQFGEDPRKT